MDARDRVFARHPKTTLRGAARRPRRREPRASSARRSTASRTCSSSSARASASSAASRAPRAASSSSYQDRILFGTDAVPPPAGESTPQQVFKDELYEIYFRFLETEDEYFDYAPAPVPPQGRWRIYGVGLPEAILKKVYHDNAARLLGLPGVTRRSSSPRCLARGARPSEPTLHRRAHRGRHRRPSLAPTRRRGRRPPRSSGARRSTARASARCGRTPGSSSASTRPTRTPGTR